MQTHEYLKAIYTLVGQNAQELQSLKAELATITQSLTDLSVQLEELDRNQTDLTHTVSLALDRIVDNSRKQIHIACSPSNGRIQPARITIPHPPLSAFFVYNYCLGL